MATTVQTRSREKSRQRSSLKDSHRNENWPKFPPARDMKLSRSLSTQLESPTHRNDKTDHHAALQLYDNLPSNLFSNATDSNKEGIRELFAAISSSFIQKYDDLYNKFSLAESKVQQLRKEREKQELTIKALETKIQSLEDTVKTLSSSPHHINDDNDDSKDNEPTNNLNDAPSTKHTQKKQDIQDTNTTHEHVAQPPVEEEKKEDKRSPHEAEPDEVTHAVEDHEDEKEEKTLFNYDSTTLLSAMKQSPIPEETTLNYQERPSYSHASLRQRESVRHLESAGLVSNILTNSPFAGQNKRTSGREMNGKHSPHNSRGKHPTLQHQESGSTSLSSMRKTSTHNSAKKKKPKGAVIHKTQEDESAHSQLQVSNAHYVPKTVISPRSMVSLPKMNKMQSRKDALMPKHSSTRDRGRSVKTELFAIADKNSAQSAHSKVSHARKKEVDEKATQPVLQKVPTLSQLGHVGHAKRNSFMSSILPGAAKKKRHRKG